jgi:hypothetical protein
MFDFDMSKVPQEMKEASQKMRSAIIRERKARQQFSLWRKEFDSASDCLKAEEKSYGEISLRWDPETQTMSPSLENAPTEQS